MACNRYTRFAAKTKKHVKLVKRKMDTGWWYTYPSEKYESVGVTIPNVYAEIELTFQTTRSQAHEAPGVFIGFLKQNVLF